MMTNRPARRGAIALAAVAAFALLGTMPAGAADSEALYTGYADFVADQTTAQGFATVSKTDAALAPLPETLPLQLELGAIEIVDGIGYAVGEDVEGTVSVFRWEIESGDLLNTFEITSEAGFVDEVLTLTGTVNDAELPDGTLITLVVIETTEGDETIYTHWIGSIDPLSGIFTPLVDVQALFDDVEPDETFYVDSLATDPLTGITWMFADYDDGVALAVSLDLNAGTHSLPAELTGLEDTLPIGYLLGADFDASGILWFWYSGAPTALGKTDGPFSLEVTGTTIGPAPQLDKGETGRQAQVQLLAVGPVPALANTGSTSTPIEALLLGGLALSVAGGAALVIVRRTSRSV